MYLIIIRIVLIAKSIQLKKLDISQIKFHALRPRYATFCGLGIAEFSDNLKL